MKGKINNYLSKRYKRSLRIRNTAIAVMLATGLFVSGAVGGESRLQISHAQEAEQTVDENSTGDAAKENITTDNTENEEVVTPKEETGEVSETKEAETTSEEAESEETAVKDETAEVSDEKEPEAPEAETNDGSKAEEDSSSEAEETTAPEAEEVTAPENDGTTSPEAEESKVSKSEESKASESEEATASESEENKTVEPEEVAAANDSAEVSTTDSATSKDETKEAEEKAEAQKTEDAQTDASSDEDIEDGYEMADPSDTYDATKPTVKLESMSYIKLYDGQPLVDDMQELLVEEGWLDGDGATYIFTESQTEIGSIPNKFTITLNEGTPEGKYNILVKYGELRVTENLDEQQYILSIAGKSESVKYDGTEHSLQGFVLSARGNDEYRVDGKGDPDETLSFTIDDATYYVSGVSAYGSGTDAGDYVVDISGSPSVKDAQGNDVTNNFKFEYVPGVLTIEKRSLKMKSASANKEYDGEELTKHEVKATGDGFADGEGATYEFTGVQKEVGESYNYFTYTLDDGTLESNYEIQKVPGKLTVKEAKKNESENSSENNSSENGSSENGSSEGGSTQENNSSSGESSGSSESSSNEGTANGTGAGTETASNNAGESVSAADGAADTSSEGPAVLGAKKGKEDSTDSASDAPAVLGARKGSTDDATASIATRILIMLLSAMTVIYITGKNKRKSNG